MRHKIWYGLVQQTAYVWEQAVSNSAAPHSLCSQVTQLAGLSDSKILQIYFAISYIDLTDKTAVAMNEDPQMNSGHQDVTPVIGHCLMAQEWHDQVKTLWLSYLMITLHIWFYSIASCVTLVAFCYSVAVPIAHVQSVLVMVPNA